MSGSVLLTCHHLQKVYVPTTRTERRTEIFSSAKSIVTHFYTKSPDSATEAVIMAVMYTFAQSFTRGIHAAGHPDGAMVTQRRSGYSKEYLQ